MVSVGQVASAIRAGIAQIADAGRAVAAAEDVLESATSTLGAAVAGSGRDELVLMLGALQDATGRLDDARSTLRSAYQALTRYLTTIGADQAGSGAPVLETAAPSLGQPPPPAWDPVGPDADLPPYVTAISDSFHHVGRGSGQTVGYLVDRAGRSLHDGRIISGSDGPGRGAPGLRPDHPMSDWDVPQRHVEGHAAALLRRPAAPRDAVLVISRPPCREQQGCHWVLPYIIPAGSSLHVYVAEPGRPPRFHHTYAGNGKAVSDG